MAEGARRVRFDEAVNVLRIENDIPVQDSVASGAPSLISITLQETSRATSASNVRHLAGIDEERFNPALKGDISRARLEASIERIEEAKREWEEVASVQRAQLEARRKSREEHAQEEEQARRESLRTGLYMGAFFVMFVLGSVILRHN